MGIASFLDLDWYKLTMGQFVFHRYPNEMVTYTFRNRTTSRPIGKVIPLQIVEDSLRNLQKLLPTPAELEYLRTLGIFQEDYLLFLKNGLVLPEVHVAKVGDAINIAVVGPWSSAIYWETYILSTINELYYHFLLKKYPELTRETCWSTGKVRLKQKIARLHDYPDILFSEFGTRRRYSLSWQETVAKILMDAKLGNRFLGFSNVRLSMIHGKKPQGTMAHELFMVMARLGEDNNANIRSSHNRVLQEWWDEYNGNLTTALTDTYGTDFFFKDFSYEQAVHWAALRQDSGDPKEFGYKAIKFYEAQGIDPLSKTIVFSDGLDIYEIIRLHLEFAGKIKTAFGWGTSLTNDVGLTPLSLVVKPIVVNGRGTVKFSDNLAKATGHPDDISRFKKVFGYYSNINVECTY